MIFKRFAFLILAAVLLSGCQAFVMKDAGGLPGGGAEGSGHHLQNAQTDTDLFEEALIYLRNDEKEPNYIEAKSRLEKLVEQYPKSRWTGGAEALIASIEKISSLQTRIKQEKLKAQAEQGKLAKEIEGLKNNGKHVDDKCVAEMTRLQQENEQLKNDIQQLKKLEVQLEKREKMLR